jgi:hypothetical protein
LCPCAGLEAGMTDFYGMTSCPIPRDARRRVYVADYGYGLEQDRITVRDVLYGIGVMLDSGEYQTFSPSQIVDPPVGERSAVIVPFPTRFRMIGDPA